MFSPALKKPNYGTPHGDRSLRHGSPATPLPESRRKSALGGVVPGRPDSGTPAPFASRQSILPRVPIARENENVSREKLIEPICAGEFPQPVRAAQENHLLRVNSGGMDRATSLSWMICGNQLFVWNYLSGTPSQNCVCLDLPISGNEGDIIHKKSRSNWLVCFVNWKKPLNGAKLVKYSTVAVLLLHKKRQIAFYWPDIYADYDHTSASTITLLAEFNSLIASPTPDSVTHECLAIACSSSGELWLLRCCPDGICHEKTLKVLDDESLMQVQSGSLVNKNLARSLVWQYHHVSSRDVSRQFFVLTDQGVQYWSLEFGGGNNIKKQWSYDVVGSGADDDCAIKKDLAGHEHICLLDMQIDGSGKELTIFMATFCKDRISGSSYTQYSSLVLQCRFDNYAAANASDNQNTLEIKAPLQVITRKVQSDDHDMLFDLRLRVGGKPDGSIMILSGDGTATVSYLLRGASRLYQFELPWDAGNVIDASVLPSASEANGGSWVVLTEKTGTWVIPENAILYGGVESPEWSPSRKVSSKEGLSNEEKRILESSGSKLTSVVAKDVDKRQRATLIDIDSRTAQDEEAEALVIRLFNDFLFSGKVEGSYVKLKNFGAFDKDGEANVFVRVSKSIIDTLAKHWTTNRGSELIAMAVVSSQLLEKQQRHQKFLHFLAVSQCHEKLSLCHRQSVLAILEHGEKLAGVSCLRELQNNLSATRSKHMDSSGQAASDGNPGALWDLIQIVGERIRRNNVLLIDRENAEVFFSRVSDLEEMFLCLEQYLPCLIEKEQSYLMQTFRACEISNACTALIHAAIDYRNEQHMWYPYLDGLCPWYCKPAVRSSLWCIVSFILQLLSESEGHDKKVKAEIMRRAEVLADVLLESYEGSLAAKSERDDEYTNLRQEYSCRRDTLLESLYQHVKELADATYQESYQGSYSEKEREAVLNECSEKLVGIARRHGGYGVLWSISLDLNDPVFLRGLMHETGLEARFSIYVFERLYEDHQYSKILRLGEEFPEDLVLFLRQHKELLWLHEIFLREFSSASESLHNLALSHDDQNSMSIEESENRTSGSTLSLADRRYLLNISKISVLAGRGSDWKAKLQRIEADLQLLKVQEEVQEVCRCENLLPPRDLIELCLKTSVPELVMRTFDVFAWTSSSFRKSNRGLLEECWMRAANLDDWAALYSKIISEGWSDKTSLEALQETCLFRASNRCYGPGAQIYGGGFDEVLPVQKENLSDNVNEELPHSVEAVLRRHPDFPEAGRLMLTAVVMPSVHGSSVMQEL